MADVESLELLVKGNASGAMKSVDNLIETLKKLKTATAGGCGLSAVTREMGKLKNVNIGLSSSNKSSAKSFGTLATKVTAAWIALKKTSQTIASWITSSNDYVENLNLFTVSMGEYADSAKEYAETVGNVMGLDPSEWMRSQGVFMTLATGFGVAGDRAATMSKQLTQLGYDLSSFFNISVEESMSKLKSGFAGELEPLRNLGYDLSQAKLEAIALSLGIDKAVSSMTQAEKAQLRYYAIMTQVTTAHGDMSRTLNAPANQLRILRAQVDQAARALGNIFIPILNAVLPYAIALARIIRELAMSIASLFGFSLPEIDYSGLEGVGGSASTASDAMDEATGSANKLKKTLLGIDELNVLPDTSSSGGGGAGGGGGGGFDFELPEYTFLDEIEDKVGGIQKKLTKMLKPVGKILEALYEYKDLVLAGLGVAALAKLWGAITTWWSGFKALRLVDAFLTGFRDMREGGLNVFQSLLGGIDNVRNNLTGIQKAAIVAVAGFAEFMVVKNSVRDLALGCEDVTSKIVSIGVVAAAAAAAMYVALGPAGLAIAAVVALGGAIVGLAEAGAEARKQLVDEAFFDGVGVSLDTLRSRLEALTEQFSTQNKQIGDWRKEIDSNYETIDRLNLQIGTISATLGANGPITQDEIEKIKGYFNSLYETVKEKMSLSEEIIMTALVGAMQRATPEISRQIDLLIGEYMRYVRETQGRAAELKQLIDNGYDQLVGKQKGDPAYQEIMDKINGWYKELGYLSGGMSDAGWQWQETVKDFNNNEIDFGSTIEETTAKIDEIAACGETALNDLAIARDTVLKEIDQAIKYAAEYGSFEEVQMLGDIRASIEADYASQEAAIKNELNAIFEDIQTGMILEIEGVKKGLEAKWDDMSWLEHWWNGSTEENYVRDGLRDLQGRIDTISEAIQGHMDTLETDGSAWAGDAMRGILDALFDVEYYPYGGGNYYSYARTLDEAIEKVFADLEKSGKKNATSAGEEITRGLGAGIAATAREAAFEIDSLADLLENQAEESLEINSPSKVFERIGGYTIDGLIKGLEGEERGLSSSMNTLVKSAFSTRDADSYGYSWGKAFGDAISRAIKNTSFPSINASVNSSGSSAKITFKAYAGGGFPDAGQMFVAREAGPELVGSIGGRTAVANNDQIVDSVAQGVYRAVVQANGQSGGNQVIEAKVNDKVLFEVVVNRNKQETMRTGYNPLLGGV